ncbi:FG-GAP-like repeat-containing protein [Streptomyces albus]|uniref:FG-GAP-like repeat-containing protein n=1 Tax=Streptomyces albus TaxID=1888 RepID=UPI00131A9E14|nr:FG-GAP-like repeat-containing protein [Streptomyces albus]
MPEGRVLQRRRARRAAGVAGLCAALVVGLGVTWHAGTPQGGPGATQREPKPVDESTAQAKARAAGERVEVTALRTETSTTYAMPDGSFTLETGAAPIRAKVDGEWKKIDTDLRRTAHGWAPHAAADPVMFSAGGGEPTRPAASHKGRAGRAALTDTSTGEVAPAVYVAPAGGPARGTTVAEPGENYTDLVTLTSAGHQVTVSWPGTLPTPVIDGSRALYRDVFPEVDLLLTARDSGFNHVLIVHTPEAAASEDLRKLSYGLTSPDLTFHLDETTKAVTAQDEKGAEIAISPTPFMWDSTGEPAVTQGEDPDPAEPSAEPAPEAPEESGAPHDGESESDETPSETDTDAPDAPGGSPAPSTSSSSEAPPAGETTAEPAAFSGPRTAAPVQRAALKGAATRLDDSQVLALKGLTGPHPGTRAATAGAALSAPGTTAATLTVTPEQKLMAASGTAYPLFIDPSFYGHTTNWTTAYKKYPSSSFYDGANYNSGTTEARVGYESTTWGTSRSFFRLDLQNIKGAKVTSAHVRVRETYSWSCSGRVVELWHTGSISSKTTWSNQPSWKSKLDSRDVAHGYNSSCPDAYVSFDAKALAQDAADGGWGSTTIGFQAYNETSAYAWKKFRAEGSSAPRLSVSYYRKPTVPSSLDQSPGPTCSRTTPYPRVGKRDLVLSAHSSDKDGDLERLNFELWRTSHMDTTLISKTSTTNSSGNASVTIPSTSLTNGWTYSWQVQAEDEIGATSGWAPLNKADYAPTCRFIYDSSFPNSPSVTSADYPEETENGDTWSVKELGQSGTVTFAPESDADVTAFGHSLNTPSCSTTTTVAAGASATITIKPQLAGPNVLYVCAKDSAGNASQPTAYVFYVSPRDTADKPGDVTGDALPDLYVVDSDGNLRMYPSSSAGDLHRGLEAAHEDGTLLILDPDADGQAVAPGYWKGADGSPALIAHGGDVLPGDGVGDFFARMPDGELYVYRGDGYGGTDISRRLDARLPDDAPDPATFDQMIVGDYNLDERPDLFVTTSTGGMWALTGYTGAEFTQATPIATSAWLDRDLVTVGDINQDDVPDLLFRSESDNLRLRLGVEANSGGATLASLSTSAGSLGGSDSTYASGWTTTDAPSAFLRGTPDVNGDSIPDVWSMAADGSIKFYPGGKTSIGTGTTVISSGSNWGTTKLSFG